MPGTAFVFFIVAAALFVYAVGSVWRSHRVLSRGVTTYGTVADSPPNNRTEGAHEQVIEYNLLSGSKALISDSRAVRSGRFKVGDRVPLVFDPELAGCHRVLDFRELWLVPLAVGAVAAVIAIFGVVALP